MSGSGAGLVDGCVLPGAGFCWRRSETLKMTFDVSSKSSCWAAGVSWGGKDVVHWKVERKEQKIVCLRWLSTRNSDESTRWEFWTVKRLYMRK